MSTATDFKIDGADLDFLRQAIVEDFLLWLAKPVWDSGILNFCDGRILVQCQCPEPPPSNFDCWVVGDKSRSPDTCRACPRFDTIMRQFSVDAGANLPTIEKPENANLQWVIDRECQHCGGRDFGCEDCDGTGRDKLPCDEAYEKVKIGPLVEFQKRFVWVIGQLQNPFVGMPAFDGPLWFTHAAGRGALMPMLSDC